MTSGVRPSPTTPRIPEMLTINDMTTTFGSSGVLDYWSVAYSADKCSKDGHEKQEKKVISGSGSIWSAVISQTDMAGERRHYVPSCRRHLSGREGTIGVC
jgi:hypothetical protein